MNVISTFLIYSTALTLSSFALNGCGESSFLGKSRNNGGTAKPAKPLTKKSTANQEKLVAASESSDTQTTPLITPQNSDSKADGPDIGGVQTVDTTTDASTVVDSSDLTPVEPIAVPKPKSTTFADDKGKALSLDDEKAIKSCLDQWPGHPFVIGNVYRIRKISTAISFGGVTIGGNDSPTAEPKLVLMTTSVNVNIPGYVEGVGTYNFVNPNGYYCLKNQVNVASDVVINLHCKAKMASSTKQFNVLSGSNGNVAQNQVSLLSNVTLRTVCD